MITFSVATNFEPNLLEKIAELNEKHKDKARIVEVYGSVPGMFLGSCRVKGQLPVISEEQLKEHIKTSHDFGIKFNYTMNANISTEFRVERAFRNYFLLPVLKLNEWGVNSITVADVSLLNFLLDYTVNHNLPNISPSLVIGIDKLPIIVNYFKEGITVVMLNQHTVNRNKSLLEEVNNMLRGLHDNEFRDKTVSLYANVSCLNHCPIRDIHYDFLSRVSMLSLPYSTSSVDPFMLWCSDVYLKNPVELLKSPFIRPEDTEYYGQFGITHFKLSDRREPTDALVELYDAYMTGEFHGNLFDLLFRSGRKWTNAVHGCSHAHIDIPNIHIDNNKLTEMRFIENVMSLKGEDLQAFYIQATKRAVRIEMI
ncbi:hypothetical protein J4434_04140 [Candidatus Woesearchaeota archaeon]|nr:hypothetical protein [Candidatus Woesearchaeota archaeon]